MKKIKIGLVIFISIALVGLVLSGVVFAKFSSGEEGKNLGGKYVSDEIIVKFKGDEKPFRVIKVPEGRVGEKIKEHLARKDVVYAEPNYIAYALMVPNDPYYKYQWNLDNPAYGGIQMQKAWDISSGAGVTVAVVDTGIRKGTDLASTCFVPGWDYVNNDSDPIDDNGHGTHVAGTVAQSTNNSLGVAGVAYKSCLMPVKVLNSVGSGTYTQVANGIYYAADNGAKVINLSLGGSSDSATLKDAVAYAYNKGVTVVAAAGNDSSNVLIYPAAYDEYVIAVGATQYGETKAPYSNYGPSLDLVAPGGNTSVDQNKDGYADGVLQQTFTKTGTTITWGYYFFQGTSMAAPHVSGVAALLIAKGNATTPDEIRAALQETAEDKGTTGRDDIYGYGLVDAFAALNWISGPVDSPPAVSITSPLNGATVSGIVEITADATDDVGVVQVNFYVGTTLIGTDTTSSYSVSWDSTTITDGSYTLKAIAIDTASQTASNSTTVNVDNYNNPPVANAGPDQSAYVGDTINFNGSGSSDPDGTIVSYNWDFGDGSAGTGVTTSHVYTVAGPYSVTLVVADNGGLTGSDTAVITISEKPTTVKCWSGTNLYLYQAPDQAKKFCKCAQGSYGYKSYKFNWSTKTVWKYVDLANNENWQVSSVSSRAPVYSVTCADGKAYPTNVDFTYPK